MKGKLRKKIHLSKLYSFSRTHSSSTREHSQLGQKGYTRVVYCNDPENPEVDKLSYRDNYVSTTKYNVLNFIPKSLFEQFRRVANIYFLVVALVSFSPLAPYSAPSILVPLVVVVGATMVKEAIEDWRRRKQDIEANNRKVKVYDGHTFHETRWKKLRVGDLVRVEKDEFFPADLVLLSSSYEDGICYVETMNLDGETNLKVKQSLEVTSSLHDEKSFRNFKAVIKCEDPNDNLYTFIGSLYYDGSEYPLSLQQLLLRDSKLRNTEYVYGVAVFTGHDTKVMKNATDPPSKRSKIEKRMDKIIFTLLGILVLISFVGSIFFSIETKEDLGGGRYKRWYLRPDTPIVYFDPRRASLAAFFHFLTDLMLYGYLIPISLYVSIEIVKVDTILSDKTGTLTCNSMDFVKCSIVGTVYGRGVTEVEQAIAKRKRHQQPQELADTSPDLEEHKDDATSSKMPIKGFNFRDERLMNGHWVKEPHSEIIQQFFLTLAICHTAIPRCEYRDRSYELLHVLEFSSLRKRMSVIVRNEEGQLVLHCKGADSVMFERLSKDGQMFVAETKNHIRKFAEAGLRTMVVAYREIGEEEYRTWKVEFFEAKTSVTADRETLVDAAAEKIERDLILLGATAVEDKLQKGVPDCINKLALAGIKIWVLTGDKLETAVNIGRSLQVSCNLLREGMKQIVITLDKADLTDLQKEEDKEADCEGFSGWQFFESRSHGDLENFFLDLATDCVSVICCRSSPKQKALVTKLVKRRTGRTTLAIGDGANDVGMLQEAEVGVGISGVEGMQVVIFLCITLAIMSSDFAIAEFRFWSRLLLVHGHWCYRLNLYDESIFYLSFLLCTCEIMTDGELHICYFFYKNLAYGFTLFWFEAYSSFSGQPAYNDWYMSFYNVFFTSLPVIALGVFDRDVSAELCLKYPILHQEGVQNMLFSWPRILGWMLYGIYSSIIIFFFSTSSIYHQAFRRDGRVAGFEVLGVLLYSCVVWTVNCQILVCSNYITWIQHFFIWGSIASWYVFLVIYGSLPPMASTTAYKVLVEVCAPSPLYWFTILIVVVCALLPYFSYKVFWVNFFPMYHNLIQSTELRRGENLDSQSELRTKPGV
ncbi:hypothetical protein IFM89_023841 [Coptis chinensis]|uniref:Phospholipid-transporting ATPase n=1 Tax=Coptis chinensis TaxID=261450 RepID=A0A835IXC0_9MAGN|nr:hypothetical protein IFM89_023841 [Coptis chinensis]